MNDSDTDILSADSGTVALLNKSEIDMQIATAHKYPRSIKRFRDETLQMVTLNEAIAQECIYSLPRDGKTIEGPSARFAEVVASAWGNSRAGARVVSDQGDFVTAQGVFHDLERNVAITYEVQRRIVNSKGQRFKPDMIGVTANAACSIALRNSILKGVPKAFWSDMYEQARQTAVGTVQTLANRRSRALAVLQKMGVTNDKVFAFLRIEGEQDITIEHLSTLFGITTALKDGDTTPEQAFTVEGAAPAEPPRKAKPVDTPVQRPAEPADTPVRQTIQAVEKELDQMVDDTGALGQQQAAMQAAASVQELHPETKADAPGVEVLPQPIAAAMAQPAPGDAPAVGGFKATDGERGSILTKARNKNWLVPVLLKANLPDTRASALNADTLEGLTKEEFKLLRAALA